MDFTTICLADSPRDKYFFTLYGGDDFLQQKDEEWKELFPFDDQLYILVIKWSKEKLTLISKILRIYMLGSEHAGNSIHANTYRI